MTAAYDFAPKLTELIEKRTGNRASKSRNVIR